MQKRGGVDEFYGGSKMNVVLALIPAKMGCRQSKHGAQTLAARLDEMGRDFGNSGRMFRRHATSD